VLEWLGRLQAPHEQRRHRDRPEPVGYEGRGSSLELRRSPTSPEGSFDAPLFPDFDPGRVTRMELCPALDGRGGTYRSM
jgi:hypothetical protein